MGRNSVYKMKKTKFTYRGSYLAYVLTYFFFYFGMGVFTSVLSMYLTGLGKTKAEMSFIVSASSLFCVVMIPVVGYINDRLRKPRVIVGVMLAGVGVLSVVFAVARNTFVLYLLDGLIMGLISSISPISERMAGAGRYRYGTVRIWGTFGYAAAAQLACIIMEVTAPQLIFAMIAVTSLIAIAGFCGTDDIPFEPENEHDTADRQFSFLRTPMYLLFVVIGFIFMGASNLNMTYSPILLQELGVPTAAVGTVLFFSTVIELPIILFSNKFMDRFSGKTLTAVDFAIMFVQFLLYSFAPNAAVAIATVLLMRAIGATLFMMIMLKIIRGIVRENSVSTAMGVLNATNAVSAILMQNIGGHLVEATSIRTLYLLLAGFAAAGFVLSMFLRVQNTKRVFS